MLLFIAFVLLFCIVFTLVLFAVLSAIEEAQRGTRYIIKMYYFSVAVGELTKNCRCPVSWKLHFTQKIIGIVHLIMLFFFPAFSFVDYCWQDEGRCQLILYISKKYLSPKMGKLTFGQGRCCHQPCTFNFSDICSLSHCQLVMKHD